MEETKQANQLKSKRVPKYVSVATTQNNARNNLYTIISTDRKTIHNNGMNSSHNDMIYYVCMV